MLNRLGIYHECDRQTDTWTDGWMDGQTNILIANAVLNYVVWPKKGQFKMMLVMMMAVVMMMVMVVVVTV